MSENLRKYGIDYRLEGLALLEVMLSHVKYHSARALKDYIYRIDSIANDSRIEKAVFDFSNVYFNAISLRASSAIEWINNVITALKVKVENDSSARMDLDTLLTANMFIKDYEKKISEMNSTEFLEMLSKTLANYVNNIRSYIIDSKATDNNIVFPLSLLLVDLSEIRMLAYTIVLLNDMIRNIERI